MCILKCKIFLLYKGNRSSFCTKHGWSTIGGRPCKLTPTQFSMVKKVTLTSSAAFDVVSKDKNFFLPGAYLPYTSCCERLEISAVTSNKRAKTGKESIFDIILLLILSDNSWILDL